jgi:hypothetical protein
MNHVALPLPSPRPVDSRLALKAAVAATMLGVAGDLLFDGAGAGVNVAVWAGLALAMVWLVGSGNESGPRRRTGLLLTCCWILTLALAWRSSEWLHAGLLSLATTLLSLAVGLPPGVGVRRIGFYSFVLAMSTGSLLVLAGWMRFVAAELPGSLAGSWVAANRRWLQRGLVLSLILASTFGGLFIAADAVVEHYVVAVFHIDLLVLARHLLWFVACFWLALGVLWSTLAFEPVATPKTDIQERHQLSKAEVGLPLATMALIFGLFVLVQVRFLFGGHSLVERTAGLTYSAYARRGFFELVVAAGLVLPVILAFDWFRRKDAATAQVFRLLSSGSLALLIVVVASAVQRLRIYEEMFGLTELRFYALALLALIVLELAVCGGTVLRFRPEYFFPASLVLITLWLGSLSVVNPEATIARVNIQRASQGKGFDPAYLAKLGTDAIPTIVGNFDLIPEEARCSVASDLLLWVDGGQDWRSWTWSGQSARDSVRTHRDVLQESCRSNAGEGVATARLA